MTEVAALLAGQRPATVYRSLVHADLPEAELTAAGKQAPPAGEVFAHLDHAFALNRSAVVMWGGIAYKFFTYADEEGLPNPFTQTRVIDLQAAVVMQLDLKTTDCKSPRNVVRLLGLVPEADCWSSGTLPFLHAMHAVWKHLVKSGWTPEATAEATTYGPDMGLDAEEMRIGRWEQIRERQNNLGIERRPVPAVTPAFLLIDAEYASFRDERFGRLIEVGMVVAQRDERDGLAIYEAGAPFTSLVQLQRVEETNPREWEITGINREAVRRAPPLPRVMDAMVAAAPWESGVLVTWGPDDARLITQNCVKAGIASPVTELPLIDLQRAFARFYDMGQQQVGLQNAASFLEIDTSDLDLHRALSDAIVTWRVLERMLADGWTPHFRTWHRRRALAAVSTAQM